MTRTNRLLGALSMAMLAVVGLNLYGCSPGDQAPVGISSAVSNLKATTGNAVIGSVSLVKTANGVHIFAQLAGLMRGDHGFHIHEKGDCSSGDGKSAGGHFNPHKATHGGPDSATRHVGDLGNIVAGKDGKASYDRVDTLVTFKGTNNIIGRSIIVHAGTDDLTSQPTGDAGARVACGVIEQAG